VICSSPLVVYTVKERKEEQQLDRPAQNQFIADRLRETANLQAQEGANRFRVAAYRGAAETVESLTAQKPSDSALLQSPSRADIFTQP
jgi:hypothetical protein